MLSSRLFFSLTVASGIACAAPAERLMPEGEPLERKSQTVEVRSAADFRAVVRAYDALVAAESPATLEVRLHPGEYAGQSLRLVDDDEVGDVWVRLSAAGDATPVWRGGQLTVEGRRVSLRGLRFEGAREERHLLHLSASEEVDLQGVFFFDNTLEGKPNAPLALLTATGAETRLVARDLQVVGNAGPPGGVGIALDARNGKRWSRVHFSDSVWANNRFAVDLSAPMTRSVLLETCAWQAAGDLLWLPLDGAAVQAKNCLIEVGEVGRAFRGNGGASPSVVSVTGGGVRVRQGSTAAPEAWLVDRAPAPAPPADWNAWTEDRPVSVQRLLDKAGAL